MNKYFSGFDEGEESENSFSNLFPSRDYAITRGFPAFLAPFSTLGNENASMGMRMDRDVSARSNDTGGWTRARSRAKLPRCCLYPTGLGGYRRVLGFCCFISLKWDQTAGHRRNSLPPRRNWTRAPHSASSHEVPERGGGFYASGRAAARIVKRSASVNNKSSRTLIMPERRKGEIAEARREEKERAGLTRARRRSRFRCKYIHYLLGNNRLTCNLFDIPSFLEFYENQIRALEIDYL